MRRNGIFPNLGYADSYPPPYQRCSNFHERCAQCWIEWKIKLSISIFWVMADCIYNLTGDSPGFSSVSLTKKMSLSKMVKFTRKRSAITWNEWLINFPIFIFLCYDFVLKIHRKLYKFWVQKRPYLKYQKSENLFFIRFSTFRILHLYITTFEILKKSYREIFYPFD